MDRNTNQNSMNHGDKVIGHKEDQKVVGLHRLSVCDARHSAAVLLERDIVSFSGSINLKIESIWQNIMGLLSLRGLKYDNQDMNVEIGEQRAFLRQLKAEKHRTLLGMYRELRDISLVRTVSVHNIIPTAGRSVLAMWITGDNTYDANNGANFGSLGTSAAAPANGDTQLGTETYRKATSSVAQASNVALLSNFYTAAEVSGTFEECGWHIGGTGAANSGELLSHFLTGGIAKAATETLTVESTITVS